MTLKKYAAIVDGDVFMTITFDDSSPVAAMQIAGFASNPTVVRVSDGQEGVDVGWTWDGTLFSPPA